MQGFPKTISTGQDLHNCLALVKAGELSKDDLLDAIRQIENRRFIRCPVVDISGDRKTVTLRYCAEISAGQTVNGVVVSGVEHSGDEDGTPETTTVSLKKPLPDGEDALLVPAPVDPLDRLGMTQTQLDDIKEALK